MKQVRALALVLVVVALAALAGCDQFENPTSIIGSIDTVSSPVNGGCTWHVVLYAEGTSMDPSNGDYATAAQVKAVTGQFPTGGAEATFTTTNYEMDEVPSGTYSLFVWVDTDGNGTFEYYNGDACGFYNGAAVYQDWQPEANVVVPESGIVDVDVQVDEHWT